MDRMLRTIKPQTGIEKKNSDFHIFICHQVQKRMNTLILNWEL